VNYCEEDVDDIHVSGDEDGEHEEHTPMPKKRKVTNKPLPKRKVFPFLDLPAEIRNQIYGLCLFDPAGVYLASTTKRYRRTVERVSEDTYRVEPYGSPMLTDSSSSISDNDDDEDQEGEKKKEKEKEKEKPSDTIHPLVPALLALNKQIYQESREVLYSNDFYMGDTLAMHSFLVDIGPRAATLLKRVALIHWGEGRGVHKAYNHAAFAALSSATNLEDFIMYEYMSYRTDPKAVATQFYRDAFPWLEAMGSTKGMLEAGVDIINIASGSFYMQRRGRLSRLHKNNRAYEQMDGFREELVKLLSGRMDMIMS
jgi:hypothetical protein